MGRHSLRSKAVHFVSDLTTGLLNPISDKSSKPPVSLLEHAAVKASLVVKRLITFFYFPCLDHRSGTRYELDVLCSKFVFSALGFCGFRCSVVLCFSFGSLLLGFMVSLFISHYVSCLDAWQETRFKICSLYNI